MTDFEPGDWVTITARVVRRPIPETVEVELFDKNGPFTAEVRRDLCQSGEKPIPQEPAERSVGLLNGIAHQRDNDLWYAVGDPMGRTWMALHHDGDVEVIHHA